MDAFSIGSKGARLRASSTNGKSHRGVKDNDLAHTRVNACKSKVRWGGGTDPTLPMNVRIVPLIEEQRNATGEANL